MARINPGASALATIPALIGNVRSGQVARDRTKRAFDSMLGSMRQGTSNLNNQDLPTGNKLKKLNAVNIGFDFGAGGGGGGIPNPLSLLGPLNPLNLTGTAAAIGTGIGLWWRNRNQNQNQNQNQNRTNNTGWTTNQYDLDRILNPNKPAGLLPTNIDQRRNADDPYVYPDGTTLKPGDQVGFDVFSRSSLLGIGGPDLDIESYNQRIRENNEIVRKTNDEASSSMSLQESTYQRFITMVDNINHAVASNAFIIARAGATTRGGKIIEYRTGDRTRQGTRQYDGPGHGFLKYHEHFAFEDKETMYRAKAWMESKGWVIGSTHRPWDTDSYHGSEQAFDIPLYTPGVGGVQKGFSDDRPGEEAFSAAVRADMVAGGFTGDTVGPSTQTQQPPQQQETQQPPSQQPAPPQQPASPPQERPVAVLMAGTNDFYRVGQGVRGVKQAITNLEKKGFRVVVVPPSQVGETAEVSRLIQEAATKMGATIRNVDYMQKDPNNPGVIDYAHITQGARDQLLREFPNATFVGDSNAQLIPGASIAEHSKSATEIADLIEQRLRPVGPPASSGSSSGGPIRLEVTPYVEPGTTQPQVYDDTSTQVSNYPGYDQPNNEVIIMETGGGDSGGGGMVVMGGGGQPVMIPIPASGVVNRIHKELLLTKLGLS